MPQLNGHIKPIKQITRTRNVNSLNEHVTRPPEEQQHRVRVGFILFSISRLRIIENLRVRPW